MWKQLKIVFSHGIFMGLFSLVVLAIIYIVLVYGFGGKND
jgi:hypothetical protein